MMHRKEADMDNNIHEVEFGTSTLTQIEQLYQYDKGQILKITDKVEDGTEVQFSNNNSEITINKAINDSQVEIPDILLQENKKILAYLKIINSDSETTIKTVIIPVKARTKPADYIEPEQEKPFRKYLEEKLDEVKNIEGNVTEMQQTVEELKEAAEQSASDAATSEQNAKKSEQNASKSATNASTSASNAKKSETAAATSEQNARKITEQLTEDVSQLKEYIVDTADKKKEEIEQEGTKVLKSIPQEYQKTVQNITDVKALVEQNVVKRSANLINPENILTNMALTVTTIATLTENATYKTYMNIPVKKGESYRIGNSHRISCVINNIDEKKVLQSNITNQTETYIFNVEYDGFLCISFYNNEEKIWVALVEDEAEYEEYDSKIVQNWMKNQIQKYGYVGRETVEDATLIKPTMSGTDMLLTDSSNMNIQELHLYGKTEQKTTTGKNLFDANTIFSTFIEYGRATVTDEGVLLNGTFGATSRNFNITLKKGTYYISGGGILHILAPSDSTFDKKIVVEDEEKTFQCYIASNTYSNKLVQPQIEVGSVATDYEPYTGGQPSPNPDYPQDIESVENPSVNVAGKNLYSFSMNGVPKETTRNGIKYIKNQDGSLKIKGTATAASKYEVITLGKSPQIFKNSTIDEKFTFKIFGLPETCYWEMSFTGAVYGEKSRTFVNIKKYASKKDTMIVIPEGVTVDTTIYPMLVLGDSILEFEPYKEIQSAQPTCELNGIDDVRDELIVRADGTGQLIQRLLKEELNNNSDYVIWYKNTNTYGFIKKESKWLFRANKINIKSNKLKGITKEVGNSGAYDKNGIFADTAGLYIKILKKYLTEYTVDALKTYLRDNPITVVGLLKEPIVTELSSEQVQKIIALHTNKPNTTIWNDQNAEMQITYVADAKSYIDNKFTELSNAIIASASEAE